MPLPEALKPRLTGIALLVEADFSGDDAPEVIDFLRDLMSNNGLNLKEILIVDSVHQLLWVENVVRGWSAFFEDFLQSFQGLEDIALLGSTAISLGELLSGLGRHGDALTNLVVHSRALVAKTRAYYLRQICQTCPKLRKLCLDLVVGPVSQDQSALQCFQGFRALENLQIFCPIARGSREFVDSSVVSTYISDLTQVIRSPTLKKVTIVISSGHFGYEPSNGIFGDNEDGQWEIYNRWIWRIEYPSVQGPDAKIRVWELEKVEKFIAGRRFRSTYATGFEAFKVWCRHSNKLQPCLLVDFMENLRQET